MNDTPSETVVIPIHRPAPTPELLEIGVPRTAAEAFTFLSIRSAEQYASSSDPKWAMICDVTKQLAAFAAPFPHATARHVKWAYQTIVKRVPQAAGEAGPMLAWLNRVPALATDKAAAAPLLWLYLASCSGTHAGSIPTPQGGPGAWRYNRAGIEIVCSNEEAYELGRSHHFWATYQGRLLFTVGMLLQEMAGIAVEVQPGLVPDAPVAKESDPAAAAASEPAADPPPVEPPQADPGARPET